MNIQSMSIKLYLAGPEVFLPNAQEVAWAMVRQCASLGVVGVFPADDHILQALGNMNPVHMVDGLGADLIYRKNIEKIDLCNGVVADLTPFRGVSAAISAAIAIGYAKGQGKPVWGYSNDARPWRAKTLDWNGQPFTVGVDGASYGDDGMKIDPFTESDDLMITRSCEDKMVHLSFESALAAACRWFDGKRLPIGQVSQIGQDIPAPDRRIAVTDPRRAA
jgi:nucleoside 2-deoxyribosyltransferase